MSKHEYLSDSGKFNLSTIASMLSVSSNSIEPLSVFSKDPILFVPAHIWCSPSV